MVGSFCPAKERRQRKNDYLITDLLLSDSLNQSIKLCFHRLNFAI